jgi:hypothetical protein
LTRLSRWEARPALPVRHHARIEAAREGDVRVCASVGPAGEVVAVWSAAADLPAVTSATVQPGWASFPDPRAARPVTARVTVHAPGTVSVTSLSGLGLAHFTVQPLPGGSILLVGARSRWRSDGPDRNAVIYGADGRVLAEETLGDGIEHVLADGTGHVWVGYFDEGVFGNYGWGGPGDPPPLGACGLTRYSADLQPVWHYPSADSPHGSISDCYALNVDGDTAWTCYYTSFPVVRISDGALTGWRNHITGVRALAVSGSRAALYGGYGPDRDRLAVGRLSGGRFRQAGEYRLVLPGGEALPTGAQVIGRGPGLHVLTDDGWYQLTMSDIPSGAAPAEGASHA